METTLRMIENHGLTLIAIILLVMWLRPKLDEMWRLLFDLAKPKPAEPEQPTLPDRLAKSMDLNGKVMSLLRAVQPEFKASRAYIFTYHNGGKNVLGIDYAKVSCTYEVVALGVKPQQAWMQAMPVTMVWAFVKLINSGLGVICPCIEQCFAETDASTYETLRMQGIKSCYCVGLYSDNRMPIGFIGVDYCDRTVELTEDQVDKLKIFAERIATLFCLAGNELCACKPQEQ